LPAANNGLWIGTETGLVRWDANGITATGVPESLKHARILSMTNDRDANVWIGTDRGLARIDARGRPSLDRSGTPVSAIFEDREGNLWTAGAQGIEHFRDSLFLTWSASAHHFHLHRPESFRT
jgi:ligand-binding sensor domain-containing protein